MCDRNSSACTVTSVQTWRDLYRAALFEKDKQKQRERIAEAEKALIRRARELFVMPNDNIDEERAIDGALNALLVLRHCTEPKSGHAA
ncbi:MAG TPA: hypothetical protein VH437_23055 [Terriglobales bacterium]|jgi:hypothetical protein